MKYVLGTLFLVGFVAGHALCDNIPQPNGKVQDEMQVLNKKLTEAGFKFASISDKSGRDDARREIAELVAKQFDLMAEHRRKEIANLDKQAAELKAALAEKLKVRESVITARVDMVLAEFDGFSWGFGPKPKAPPSTVKTTSDK